MHRAVQTMSAALALLPGKLSVLRKGHYSLLQRHPSCQSNSVVKYIPCLHKFFRPLNGSMNLKRSSIGSQRSEWSDLTFSKQLMSLMGKKGAASYSFCRLSFS